MSSDRVTQSILWIFAIIFDVAWVLTSFTMGAPLFVGVFGLRLAVSAYSLFQSVAKNVSQGDYLSRAALWIWIGAFAGLMVGNIFLFIILSLGCMGLLNLANESRKEKK
jgi:uncharacterized membrane protein YidH (DUF202 family)